jgi:hypothetical protein
MVDSTKARAVAVAQVDAVLDALHANAAAADGDAYFALFAEGAVFLGTDAAERWTKPEFQAYAEPFFARGQGWTYVSRERRIFLDAGRDTAWFDERLDNAKYGEVRGTGVLVRRGEAWRIAQYNLAFPVPNELAPELVERIRGLAP